MDGAASEYGTLAPNTIRLLQFLPNSTVNDIHVTFVDEFDYTSGRKPYIALSYCWGNKDDLRQITMNGCTFDVTANLWQALSTIQQHHRSDIRYYWVDAICINQDDLEERNNQVHQMWRIFSNAQWVYAWLGPLTVNVEPIIDLFEREIHHSMLFRRAQQSPIAIDHVAEDPLFQLSTRTTRQAKDVEALLALASREYFERVWIITDFLQAPRLKFLIGAYSCEWELLDEVILSLHDSFDENCRLGTLDRLNRTRRTFEARPTGLELRAQDVVHGCLALYCNSRCSDVRDHLFAMLGHPAVTMVLNEVDIDEELIIVPDYSLTSNELLVITLRWIDALDHHVPYWVRTVSGRRNCYRLLAMHLTAHMQRQTLGDGYRTARTSCA
ncbi:Heterokaryon incompatibility protein 6, OR allele [Pseudocercospora fuligena]|uniref:Heterokaryon incompatibility protein 6, OR allele n=1 Tax=Pseudocercospora fuligena TaxID=685502 RepID=A0A8H6RC32_9PEZI|nr:Heterokaryon incompatibility protein 6, OR allele [Pseudocercospora fuligena]